MEPSASPAARPAPAARAALGQWGSFAVASMAVFLVANDSTMLFAAFGALRLAFPDSSAAALSWVLNAYTVVFATMLVPAGGLADRFGRKRVFMAGLALFLGASAAAGLAPTPALLVAARVIEALGAALLTPSSLAIILAAFAPQQRAIAVGLWGAASALGAAAGPILGSVAVDRFGWPAVFFVNLGPGLAALWAARHLHDVRGEHKANKVDLAGMALLIAAAGALATAITQSGSANWSRAELAVLAASGLAALAAFAVWIRIAAQPLVDPELFRNPTYTMVNLATLAYNIAFTMMFFSLFSYLTKVWHYSLPLAGLAIVAGPLTVVPVAFLSGRYAARAGHRPLLVLGSLLFAASGLWLLLVPGTEPAYLERWLPAMLVSGAGIGMALPSLSGAAVAGLAPARFAVGSAVNQAIRQFGAVLGVALTVRWLGAAELEPEAFAPVFQMQIGLALLSALLCLGVRTRPVST